MKQWFNTFWHDILRRPYRLAVPINEGKGQTVVLLHGLASTHRVWGYVLPHISKDCRVVALDLLGFGTSPKPKNCAYTAQDHARAVIATLNGLGIYRNAIFVGHSMGSLIAVEVAKQKPKLVKQLVLCGMPVYQFDAARRLLPNQDSMYLRMYRRMAENETTAWNAVRLSQRLLRVSPEIFGVERKELFAAQRSLANTIIHQTTYTDIQKLQVPIHLVGGRLDAFVIGRHLRTLGRLMKGSTLQFLNETHEINERFGAYIAEVVNASAEGREVRADAVQKRKLLKPKKNLGG